MKCRCGKIMYQTHAGKYWCRYCGRLLIISNLSGEKDWYISEGKQAALQSLRAILAHIENEYETANPDKTIAFIKESCKRDLAERK